MSNLTPGAAAVLPTRIHERTPERNRMRFDATAELTGALDWERIMILDIAG